MARVEIDVPGAVLDGHRAGTSRLALLLHGGAAVPDYMGGCATALDGLFATIRYTQRGTPPSSGEQPYTIETHVADAIAVLDFCELDRASAVGQPTSSNASPSSGRSTSPPARR